MLTGCFVLQVHDQLAQHVVQASAAAAQCRASGTQAASWQPISSILATSVASLKQQARRQQLSGSILASTPLTQPHAACSKECTGHGSLLVHCTHWSGWAAKSPAC